MRSPRVQFSTGQMMVAVLISAILFALLRIDQGLLIACYCLPSIVVSLIGWWITRRRRTLAFIGCVGICILANSLGSLACIYAFGIGEMVVSFLLALFTTPIILGFGIAWACAVTRPDEMRLRSPLLAWSLVVILTAQLPVSMYFHWPIRLAFLASRPVLNRIADRVAAGNAIRQPQWAGVFCIVESRVDSKNGNVALITDTNPNGPSGLVRLGPNNPGDTLGPIYNHNIDLPLDGRWRCQEED